MNEQIKLYSQDYQQVVFTTEDRSAAIDYLRNTGQDSMPMVIDFGNGWTQRWAGRLVMQENGCVSTIGGSEFLEYIHTWPIPDLT